MLTFILLLIFSLTLFLPLAIKRVEKNLELFLFVVAVITLTFSHVLGPVPLWNADLIRSSLVEPIKLSVATLIFGFLFRAFRDALKRKIISVEEKTGPRLFAFLLIFSLGILSSVITAIIAALILCEVITALRLDRKYETILTIFACFSIGMGAALMPIGEPLSTIVIAKFRGGDHPADYLFLLKLIGAYIIPGMVIVSAIGGFLRGAHVSKYESLSEDYPETFKMIVLRAWKVYIFVMALILLGEGFRPLIDNYISRMPGQVLYWINMTSAVLDNATLAAAEIGPHMDPAQLKGILMGLIISGGILIPGNIPNIIAASKLGISSRAWAVIGVPIGLSLMGSYYVILYIW
ncbi:MAG: DUF1646 family protein [Dissulfurimicrobium sp.]|uniref:DUF1646 family protein n=1 Tax=Dissulfurimicrobium sp. TaxID=2022436 RepID=UPI00404A42F4